MRNEPYPYYPVGEYDTINALLKYVKEKYNERIAFKYTKNGEKFEKDYATFYEEVYTLADSLNQNGYFKKKIGIVGENSYEWILAYMAVAVSGNIVVPIDKDLSYEEFYNIVVNVDICALFYDEAYTDYADNIKENLKSIEDISFEKIDSILKEEKKFSPAQTEVMPDDLSTIIFTSGTTGTPKGVLLTHKNLCEDVRLSSMQLLITGDSVLILPLHHTFAFTANILCMLNIGYAICIPRSSKRIEEALKRYKPKTLFLVPMLVEALYNKIDFNADDVVNALSYFGGMLNLIVSGGAALEQKYVDLYENYGVTVLNRLWNNGVFTDN